MAVTDECWKAGRAINRTVVVGVGGERWSTLLTPLRMPTVPCDLPADAPVIHIIMTPILPSIAPPFHCLPTCGIVHIDGCCSCVWDFGRFFLQLPGRCSLCAANITTSFPTTVRISVYPQLISAKRFSGIILPGLRRRSSQFSRRDGGRGETRRRRGAIVLSGHNGVWASMQRSALAPRGAYRWRITLMARRIHPDGKHVAPFINWTRRAMRLYGMKPARGSKKRRGMRQNEGWYAA